MTHYVLGIDGGGTKTQAAIVDETGQVRGTGAGGPSNYDDVGVDRARENIARAVAGARDAAACDPAPFEAAFLGLAGIVSPADRAVVQGIAADLGLAPADRVGVDHDCRIALAGGLSGRPGIVLIAGTGSSCYGRNAAGADWRAGGWGSQIGDEGSAYWHGLQALQSAVRAYDGRGPATCLETDVRRTLGLTDMNDIMRRLHGGDLTRVEIAALARLVLAAAHANDPVAGALVRRAGEDLADCVRAVAERLGLLDESCEIVLVGGLVQNDGLFAQTLQSAILRRLPRSRCRAPELPPVFGATLLALGLAGKPADETCLGAMRRAAMPV